MPAPIIPLRNVSGIARSIEPRTVSQLTTRVMTKPGLVERGFGWVFNRGLLHFVSLPPWDQGQYAKGAGEIKLFTFTGLAERDL